MIANTWLNRICRYSSRISLDWWVGCRLIMSQQLHKRSTEPARREPVFDHMGSTELAANLFRATQTEEKLRRENVRNKDLASRIHNEVGRKVRQTIHELGGTIPENLPVAESIKKVESREKKRLRAEQKKALQSGTENAQ